jgi:cytochrome c-type biogenesis protein CcmF
MGSPAVISRLQEDLYVSAVQVASDQVSVRVYIQPLVLWVWVGGILLVLGALVAPLPGYRAKRREEAS